MGIAIVIAAAAAVSKINSSDRYFAAVRYAAV